MTNDLICLRVNTVEALQRIADIPFHLLSRWARCTEIKWNSTIIGTLANGISSNIKPFTEKVPPSFNDKSDYRSYKNDDQVSIELRSLPKPKQGPSFMKQLVEESKSAAHLLFVKTIFQYDGADIISEQLEKSYCVGETSQLDTDVAFLHNYRRAKNLPADQFFAGFHARFDTVF